MNSTPKPKLSSRLITFLPILTLMVLVYGSAKQFIYYYNFNLDIFSFLEVTELLPQTIFDLFIGTFYLAVGCISALYFSHLTTNVIHGSEKPSVSKLLLLRSTVNNLKKEFEEQKSQNTKALRLLLKAFAVYALIIILCLFSTYDIITDSEIPKQFPKFSIAFRFLFQVGLIALISAIIAIPFAIFNYLKDRTLQIILTLSIFLIISGCFNGWFKYLNVIKNHSHRTYTISIGKNIIASDDNYYYIGKCKNFAFFYCSKDNMVTAYPMSSVTELSIGGE